jgi:hypothetical protein
MGLRTDRIQLRTNIRHSLTLCEFLPGETRFAQNEHQPAREAQTQSQTGVGVQVTRSASSDLICSTSGWWTGLDVDGKYAPHRQIWVSDHQMYQ